MRFSSRFLRLEAANRVVYCHANCSQFAQGTSFLSSVSDGSTVTIVKTTVELILF